MEKTGFWKRMNPRLAKQLAASGVPAAWRERDGYIDVLVPLEPAVLSQLHNALRVSCLGEAIESDHHVRCVFADQNRAWAVQLVIEELRRAEVPRDALLRVGISQGPGRLVRVFDGPDKTNLRKVGKPSQLRPHAGDVFAYSFDKRGYHFGIVLRDMPDDKVLVAFPRGTSPTTAPVAPPTLGNELVAPMVVDDQLWRRGIFANVSQMEIRAKDLDRYCMELRGPDAPPKYLSLDGNPTTHRVVVDPGFSPWLSVDNALSEAHGIPLLSRVLS